MITKKKLLEFEYYLQRMSMFMNESHGFADRMRIFWSIMTSFDDFYNKLFEYYDILDVTHSEEQNFYYNNYLKSWDNLTAANYFSLDEDMRAKVEIDADGKLFIRNELLDKVGSIFNCSRTMTIKCSSLTTEQVTVENPDDPSETFSYNYEKYDNLEPTSIADIEGENSTTKYIILNNLNYLIYIKMQIRKQYFNGTREELAAIYFAEDTKYMSEYDLQIYYITQYNTTQYTNPNPATVVIYWATGSSNVFTPTMRYLFLNGLLTIESLGINYDKLIDNITMIAYFGDENQPRDNDAIYAEPESGTPTTYCLWG